jgi:PAS domain S-box-containing protein
MMLYRKTLIIVSITTFSLILILYVTSQTVLLNSFTKLEKRFAAQDIERAMGTLSNEVAALDKTVSSAARSDAIYAFIQSPSTEHIPVSLTDETAIGLGINLVLLMDQGGQIAFGRAFDLRNERPVAVPESLQVHLGEGAALVHHDDVESSVAGIVLLPEGPLLVASRPILAGAKEGPIHGTLIMGRYLDSVEIERLAEASRLSLTVHRFDDANIPSDFRTARSFFMSADLEQTPTFVRELGLESIAGYGLLENIYGEPCLILRVDTPREIYHQGRGSALYFISALVGVSLVFGLMTLLLLQRVILSRLTQLSSNVGHISTSGDLSMRVAVKGEDELSDLAGTINEMLTALERAQQALQESEERYRLLFDSGGDIVLVSELTDKGIPGRIIEVNDVACQILGHTKEEMLEMWFLDLTAFEDWGDFPQLAERLVAERQVLYEATSVARDGTRIPVEFSSHIFDLGGQPAVLSIARDITERKQAEEALERRNRELTMLYEASTAISSDLSLNVVLQTVAEQVAKALGASGCALSLWDHERNLLETLVDYSASWPDETDVPGITYDLADYPSTLHVLKTAQPLVIQHDDPTADGAELALMRKWEAFTLLMLPLIVRDRVVGMVELVDDVQRRDYTPEDIRLTESLVTQAAVAIENAQLHEQTQRRLEEQTALREIGAVLSSTLDLETVLSRIAEQMGRAIDATSAYISSYEPQTMQAVVLAEYIGPHACSRERVSDLGAAYAENNPEWLNTMQTGQHNVSHIGDPDLDKSERDHMERYGAKAVLYVPLLIKGQLVGYVELWESRQRREFTPEEITLCQGIAQQAAIAMENARLYDQAQQEIAERKQAEAALREQAQALRASEQRLRDVTHTTGDWIWEMDTEGRYTYVSPIVEQILGYTPEEILGRHHSEFFRPDGRKGPGLQDQGLFDERHPAARLSNPSVHKDGHLVILETSILPLTDAEGNLLGYRGAHRDVTTEHQLRERLATVYILGQELVLSADEQQIAAVVVDAVKLLLECQLCALWLVDEEKQALVCQVVKATDQEQIADITAMPLDSEQGVVVAVAQTGEAIYLPDVQKDARYVDAGIQSRSELCVPVRMGERTIGVINAESAELDAFDSGVQQLLLTLADQTALALENAQLFQREREQREHLRALATRLTETEEIERRRLARELHDRVGQSLTALGINLNVLRKQIAEGVASPMVHGRLDDSLALVRQTTKRIRNVMADLQSPVLEDYGLVAALRGYGAQFASRTGVEVTVQGDELGLRPPVAIENVLFRISQEALTNVSKHAQATQVTITVEMDDEMVRLTITDDGVGFDLTRESGADEHHGWGLLTMAERAEAMGGHFRIESRPQEGTRIMVEVTR